MHLTPLMFFSNKIFFIPRYTSNIKSFCKTFTIRTIHIYHIISGTFIIFQKNDERTTYNMIYMDGTNGKSFAKRFNVTGVTRDKEYFVAKEHERSKVHYLSVNPNAEAETVRIILT